MLVLSRKESEQLVIGGDIVVTVSRISGNRVQLTITAPLSVRIQRGELSSTKQSNCSKQSENRRGDARA